MKRASVLIIACLLLSCLIANVALISAQGNILDSFEEKADKALETKQKIDDFSANEDKWSYLSEEWRNVLLNNTIIAGADERLQKINPLLFFLFGEDYSFGITFFFLVIVWLVFFVTLLDILLLYSTFAVGISWPIAFIFTIICAHLSVFRFISNLIFTALFTNRGFLSEAFLYILMLALIVYAVFSYQIFRRIKVWRKMRSREAINKINEEQLERGAKVAAQLEAAAAEKDKLHYGA